MHAVEAALKLLVKDQVFVQGLVRLGDRLARWELVNHTQHL